MLRGVRAAEGSSAATKHRRVPRAGDLSSRVALRWQVAAPAPASTPEASRVQRVTKYAKTTQPPGLGRLREACCQHPFFWQCRKPGGWARSCSILAPTRTGCRPREPSQGLCCTRGVGCACNTRWQARSQAPSPPHVPRPRPMTGSPEERGEGSDRSEAFWNRRTIVDYGGRKLLRPVEIKDEWCRGGGQPAGRPAVGPAVRARACARTARQLALAPHAVHASHAKDRHRLRRSQTAAAGLRVLVRTQTSPPCGPPRTSAAAPAASAR